MLIAGGAGWNDAEDPLARATYTGLPRPPSGERITGAQDRGEGGRLSLKLDGMRRLVPQERLAIQHDESDSALFRPPAFLLHREECIRLVSPTTGAIESTAYGRRR